MIIYIISRENNRRIGANFTLFYKKWVNGRYSSVSEKCVTSVMKSFKKEGF